MVGEAAGALLAGLDAVQELALVAGRGRDGLRVALSLDWLAVPVHHLRRAIVDDGEGGLLAVEDDAVVPPRSRPADAEVEGVRLHQVPGHRHVRILPEDLKG